jgi:hypothetical protein
MLIVVLVGASVSSSLGKASKTDAADELFVSGLIPHLRIELSRSAADHLRQQPRVYVSATVREGETVYTNVAIHLKGSVGSFRPLDDKPAFTVNFGHFVEGQKFHGLKKLHLNNSVQDHTYLSEMISRDLFNSAGVPAPRAGQATVELNGRPLGVYVLLEGIGHHFLSHHFPDATGNLYDTHGVGDINRRMHCNSGDNPKDQTQLRALAAAAQEPDLDRRLARLEKTLDVDRFLSFLAMEVMICHWDGYAMNRNNYRVFTDRTQDRMVFIPHGMDQVFARANTPMHPQVVGLVAKSVLEVPQFYERYRERMAQLLTNSFHIADITNRLYSVASRVQPLLEEVDPQAAAGYMTRVASLSRRISARVRVLDHMLQLRPSQELQFDKAGIVTLAAWEPQTDLGKATLDADRSEPKHALLHIRAEGASAASWRTRVFLDKGHYRLHGRLRLEGVKLNSGDQKAGVGLRISRQKFSRQLAGTVAWTPTSFEFDVAQDHTEVELVCELRAAEGEVWFDQGSLVLIRVEP